MVQTVIKCRNSIQICLIQQPVSLSSKTYCLLHKKITINLKLKDSRLLINLWIYCICIKKKIVEAEQRSGPDKKLETIPVILTERI